MTKTGTSRLDALNLVLELGSLLAQDQAESLPGMGLTPSRAHALWVLGESGALTHRQLADALGIVPRSVTDLVDALEEDGLVARSSHPADRRASLVSLTAAGDTLAERLRREHAQFAGALFRDLSDRDVATFSRLLHRLLMTLRPLVPESSA